MSHYAILTFPVPAVKVVTLKLPLVAVDPVNPVTVMGEIPVAVIEPGVEVAVNVVAVPPVVEAVYATVAVVEPVAVAVPIVGASGTSAIGVMPGITLLLLTLAKIVIFLYAYPN